MVQLRKMCVGDAVLTPRGEGRVHAVTGGPGIEVVTVNLSLVLVDFSISEVIQITDDNWSDVAAIETFLEANPGQHLEAIEAFLADPTPNPQQPPPMGKTRGAVDTWCSCSCGQKRGCFRRSTAPDMHQENTNGCYCEPSCPCA